MYSVGILLYLLIVILAALVLYWVIRLAVRHALADERKAAMRASGSTSP